MNIIQNVCTRDVNLNIWYLKEGKRFEINNSELQQRSDAQSWRNRNFWSFASDLFLISPNFAKLIKFSLNISLLQGSHW